MSYPPGPPDPNAFTQPIPIVQPPPPPRVTVVSQSPATVPPPVSQRQAYAHRFGSVPFYLIARFLALGIDLFGLAFVLTAFGFNAFDRGLQTFAGRDQAGFVTLGGGAFAIGVLFAYLCEALTGSTLGKMTFALHTRRTDGGHAGGGRVLLRYLFVPIDLLLIGPILALVTKRHQRLGDVVAGTVVSGSRLGFIAPAIGVLVIGGLAYAQIEYGGGVTSAIEVAAESTNLLPGFINGAASLVGLGGVHLPALPVTGIPVASPTPMPQASSGPTARPTANAQTPLPEISSSPEPSASAEASGSANVDRPGYPTDPPEGTSTDTPSSQPANGIVTQ